MLSLQGVDVTPVCAKVIASSKYQNWANSLTGQNRGVTRTPGRLQRDITLPVRHPQRVGHYTGSWINGQKTVVANTLSISCRGPLRALDSTIEQKQGSLTV